MDSHKKKLLIIDGHNHLFRGYYGVPVEAKMPSGLPINAVYGFFALLRNQIEAIKPDYLLTIFDSQTGILNKQEKIPEYKTNRTNTDTTVYEQLDTIYQLLDYMNIKRVEHPDLEADDLIGSYAHQANKQNIDVYIGSNDYDFMQLVGKQTKVIRGIHKNWDIFDEDMISKKFGVAPHQYLDYHTLKGDMSDNIKILPGIGKETAKNIISQFQNIENIFENINLLHKRYQALFIKKKEIILQIKEFLRINTGIEDLPIEISDELSYDVQMINGKVRTHLEAMGIR